MLDLGVTQSSFKIIRWSFIYLNTMIWGLHNRAVSSYFARKPCICTGKHKSPWHFHLWSFRHLEGLLLNVSFLQYWSHLVVCFDLVDCVIFHWNYFIITEPVRIISKNILGIGRGTCCHFLDLRSGVFITLRGLPDYGPELVKNCSSALFC